MADCKDMQSRTSDAKLTLTYFGTHSGDLYDAFIKAAWNQSINDRFQFYHTTDAACAVEYGHEAGSEAGKISLSRQFD